MAETVPSEGLIHSFNGEKTKEDKDARGIKEREDVDMKETNPR
jgi:hypothetical protein